MPTEPVDPPKSSEDAAIDRAIEACDRWLKGYEQLKQGIDGLREIFKPPENKDNAD